MEPSEKARFDNLYESHLRVLKLRGLSESTIDVYSRAVDGRDAVGRSMEPEPMDVQGRPKSAFATAFQVGARGEVVPGQAVNGRVIGEMALEYGLDGTWH